jgi:hypothetical protein
LADGTYSIEEINQPSLNQFTSDYFSVVISNGTSVTGEDFGNVAGNPNVNVRKIHHQDHHEMIKADEHNGGGFSGGPSVSDNQGRDNRPVVDPVPTPVNDNGNQGNHGDGGHAGHFDHGNGRGHSRDN